MFGWIRCGRRQAQRSEALAAQQEHFRRCAAWEHRQHVEGWRLCAVDSPRGLGAVEFLRHGQDLPWRARWEDFRPEFNIADLYWRPVADMIDVTPAE